MNGEEPIINSENESDVCMSPVLFKIPCNLQSIYRSVGYYG